MTSAKAAFEDLVALMDRLRKPGGCPWDREQTWDTLRQYVIEEAYEVVDAIEHKRVDKVAEECGDLLFEVVFLSQIAQENGWFDVYDAITSIRDKLVRRHPHVFADVKAETARAVLQNWEAIKSAERVGEGQTSAVDGVPPALPALARALKLGQKAARAGFDWADVSGAIAKVHEELQELQDAIASKDANQIRSELGDALFALTSVARFLEVNPEDAAREACTRFEERFRVMEKGIVESGHAVRDFDVDELEGKWQAAKKFLRERAV